MRCFVAIDAGPQVTEAVTRVREVVERLDPSWCAQKWVAAQNLHVTVRFLGELEQPEVDELCERFEEVGSALAPFTVRSCGLGVRPSARRARVLWVGFDDSDGRFSRLVERVDAACERSGVGIDRRPQPPHMTVCRSRKTSAISATAIDAGTGLLTHGQVIVSVPSFSLFISRLAPRGPEYRSIGTWRLRGE